MKEIITSHDEMVKLVRDGNFFNFCIAFALNKGHRDTIKEKKKVEFTVGDYQVEFNAKQMCFMLTHKIYFARIIHAYLGGEVVFVGDNEEEVINELLTELEKERGVILNSKTTDELTTK